MNTPNTSDALPRAAATPSAAELQALLGADLARPWWQRPMVWISALVLVALAAGWYFWQAAQRTSAVPVYVTEPVRRGDLTLKVSANGTLQPTRSVNIGSELSGTVKQVLVDVNDRVKKGEVLVVLDTAKLSDQVLRSRAALAAAQAALAQSTATVKESQASLVRFEEVARLSGGKVPSATELDSARASVDRAVASEASAQANVEQARAALSTDDTNLAKASIRSPIDGVVLSRSVDPGNAVAASLQAVTLFSIAEDLKQLRLEVSVDEADVGAVKVGQKASFTVSAYPARRYPATITRVAFGSTKTDNVVTYTTYLDVDNKDLSLRPGMTAAATIISTERTGVLLVPNTALRFAPAQAAESIASSGGSVVSKLLPRMPRTGARKSVGTSSTDAAVRQIWVLKDGNAAPLLVKPGISDGRQTEVSGEALQEGQAVITDQRTAGATP
ncbi:MAG: efflux RND transporter periplasmic adaptor subunit [Gammaproteobacteria bacterium]|nr:efflux RND transporter periplasmic adaptor subunit [Gammaproteobacteria bacterium]MBU0788232.1 efflux RND transporter periplasmic adaptor subunit [Gammaproteobacteria bacterium]MBU0815271.1 efflux RND transporter periplasmic adaptor subunit [Gammaproteobacteria bacterium]MBU1785621.1 efflux RND transporter periplasmic adaptor subunit [Gammaproteobacteria bacterium]